MITILPMTSILERLLMKCTVLLRELSIKRRMLSTEKPSIYHILIYLIFCRIRWVLRSGKLSLVSIIKNSVIDGMNRFLKIFGLNLLSIVRTMFLQQKLYFIRKMGRLHGKEEEFFVILRTFLWVPAQL